MITEDRITQDSIHFQLLLLFKLEYDVMAYVIIEKPAYGRCSSKPKLFPSVGGHT